jgi:DNA-binding CsgD family transcriptional regulator
LGLQTFCALFFVADIVADLLGFEIAAGGVDHQYFEFIVVLALVLGIALTSLEIRKVLGRQKRIEAQLKAASGAFFELLEELFDAWSLTPSERDVALFAIKGLAIAEIAKVRQTKEGTVKAQCNAIYGKAGVTGRPQLLSLFIEELMNEGLIGARPKKP